ncbi:MAG: PSD1 and planctomycete cytochrome C domain-containing protein [Planctomycetota bacterium]
MVALVGHCFASACCAQSASKSIDFTREVRPLLQRFCVECHGAKLQKGELRLDAKGLALKGGASGEAFVAGKSGASELLRRVSLPKGDPEVMPARGDVLSPAQIELLKRWIDEGAAWPDNAPAVKHWSYESPVRPAVPSVANELWARGPVDRFVLERLDAETLPPSPEAGRATLLRRATLDLTGIPPTRDELHEFLNDSRPDAHERLIDRLLASPAFGEKWARHWLDLARYADSHGFQRDDLHEVWAFRDWVIAALNADLPFDQFTIEQIAGDLLPGATEAQRIATGFHRCSPTNVEAGSDPEETRVNQLIDRVNTTGAVWLGSTLECAQCHDHKYDPFTQRDYYGMLAFFNGTEIEADRSNPKVPGSIRFLGPKMPLVNERLAAERASLNETVRRTKASLDARRRELEPGLDEWAKPLREAATRQAVPTQTHVFEVADFDSLGEMTTFELLADKSILLKGEPADKDTYTIEVRTTLTNITGIRLDALTDPSLPGDGPGRGDAARPNFVLHEFEVTATPLPPLAPPGRGAGGEGRTSQQATKKTTPNGDSPLTPNPSPQGGEGDKRERPLKFTAATASFSQKNYDVAGAIDGDPKTAWAINPQFHKPHWAEFTLAEPIGFEDGTVLKFRLVQNLGAARLIGRLKLSAMVGADVSQAAESQKPKQPLLANPVPVKVDGTKKKRATKAASSDKPASAADKPLSAEILAALKVEPAQRTPQQTATLLDHRLELDAQGRRLREGRDVAEQRLRELRPDTTLVMQEMPAPRDTTIFQRGDFRTPGDPVTVTSPAILHALPDGPANRLTLARWLVSTENPLVGRVTVNRWWAELFGRGLVSTVEDFGIKGEPSTHPELLDWLAVEFVGSAERRARSAEREESRTTSSSVPRSEFRAPHFEMKRMLRQIMTSATYRQSSRVTPELLAKDDQNKLLARGPRFRLDAETIRDQALAVAGLLSDKQFGAPVRPYQPGGLWTKVGGTPLEYNVSPGEDRYRRGVYVVWKRASPYPSFVNFDATARLACTVKRSRSNTPLQALTLLNDPVYVEAAFGVARQVLDEAPSASTEARLNTMFERCLSREPTNHEAAVLRKLFDNQVASLRQDEQRTRQIVGETAPPKSASLAEFAAWQAVATALLNLDETITKP